jgi:hypothetical protein
MKKLLLSLGLVLVGSTAMSQVIFSVEAPASIAGFYDFTSNGDGSSWGTATLAGLPPVIDTVVVADDGTPGTNAQGNPASATGCNAFTAPQAQNLAGKIALVFRGDGGNPGVGACGFGVKAQNCYNAGAVAVIIVNRDATVIAMNGGTEGAAVPIPVVMVNLATGVSIMNAINNGADVVAMIGDKTGYYGDDLTTVDVSSARAPFGSKPLALAQNATEFSFDPGTWVYNYGQNSQSGVTLNTVIKRNGTQIYTQTSSAITIPSGDSAYMTTPTYSAASYTAGQYEVTYTVAMTNADEFVGDNVSTSTFALTSNGLWSLAGLNATADTIKSDGFYRAATLPTTQFESCIVLKDANAGRLKMDGVMYGGMTVGAADTATVTLDGVEVTWTLYAWNDQNQTVAAGTFDLLSQVAEGSYIYPDPADPMLEKPIFMPITSATNYQLVNNQTYLVCINNYSPKVYMAYNTSDHYDLAMNADDMIRFPIRSDAGTWTPAGFSGLPVPAIALHTGTNLGVSENELVNASAFPVPAKETITVKVNAAGDATLKIVDMAGRQVSAQQVKIENGQFQTSVAGMNAGTYVFTLDYANGTTSRFNVVVSK